MNRNEIYKALFELIGSVAEFETKSTRLKLWTDVSYAEMPYLGILQQNEKSDTTTGLNTKWYLYPEIYIYTSDGGDPRNDPYILLNEIVDKVLELLQPSAYSGQQTLNGLVHSVKLNGGVMKDGGIIGDKAVAVIPIEIITTN